MTAALRNRASRSCSIMASSYRHSSLQVSIRENRDHTMAESRSMLSLASPMAVRKGALLGTEAHATSPASLLLSSSLMFPHPFSFYICLKTTSPPPSQ